jgi:hypothetical protein
MSKRDEIAAMAFGAAKPKCQHLFDLRAVTTDIIGLHSALVACSLCDEQQVIKTRRNPADG